MSGSRSKRKSHKPSHRKSSARARSLQVLSDMRRVSSLGFTRAARNRRVDPRFAKKEIGSAFYKDPSGRIKAHPTDRLGQTLYTPSTKPGAPIPVPTRNSRERRSVGQWMEALNAGGRGDFSKFRKFPKVFIVAGVRLPTNIHEVQKILEALAEEEKPYEGLYRTLARPS